MEAKAIGKYLKMSASKVIPVVRLVRNRPVEEALARLNASPRKSARLIAGVLQSATANLKRKGKVSDKDIYVKEIFADQGPLVPPVKFSSRARGMADQIRKRTCHITVKVEARPPAPGASAGKAKAKATAKATAKDKGSAPEEASGRR
ncbi:MAG: 50S ribosomal protein L22 [Candidatus Aureabacteria bacterium]|nr:50S ribosomal protein L22 [Candidatus Auribacterota bacterium]